MRKDLKDKIDVNPIMAELSFAKFEKWHKNTLPNDELSAKDRYVKIGGKIPKKKED